MTMFVVPRDRPHSRPEFRPHRREGGEQHVGESRSEPDSLGGCITVSALGLGLGLGLGLKISATGHDVPLSKESNPMWSHVLMFASSAPDTQGLGPGPGLAP